MKHLSALLLAIALLLPASVAVAQETAAEERDRGVLTALIEDNLSGISRSVTIDGFRGALSSRASVETMRIADAEGVWLRAEGLVLDWNRAAVLGGRIEVNELSAQSIEILRPPVAEEQLPNPESTPFALPELPVSINIGQLNADRVFLGAPLLGDELTLTVNGTMSLAGGEGRVDVLAERTDTSGVFSIEAAYSNQTQELALDVVLSEPERGAVARILGLPGRPSVDLSLQGAGPISDYGADLTLATDGIQRVSGTFGFVSETDETGVERLDMRADISGDVGTLLPPDYGDFFGDDSRLALQAQRRETGELLLPELLVRTRSLSLDGSALISADGWPERLNLSGVIGAEDAPPVLLPIGGERTLVDRAEIDVEFDAEAGDEWAGRFRVSGLERPGLKITEVTVDGGGTIRAGANGAPGSFSADVAYDAFGLSFDDPGIALAIGSEIAGNLSAERTDNGPVRISELSVNGPGLSTRAEAEIAAGAGEGLQVRSTVRLTADDLSRFAELAGLGGLNGAADLSIVSAVKPLDGAFDIQLTGTTTDLAVGIAQVDPLLAGDGTLTVAAERDETGTRVSALKIDTTEAAIVGTADITSDRTDGFVQLDLRDIGRVIPDLDGPARLRAVAERPPGGATSLIADLTASGINARADVDVAAAADGGDITGRATLDIADLAPFAAIAGQDMTGGLDVELTGNAGSGFERFDVAVSGRARDLDPGNPQLAALLDGEVRLTGSIARDADGRIDLRDLDLAGARLSASAAGRLMPDGRATANFDADLPDLSVVDDRLAGRGTARGEVSVDPAGESAAVVSVSGPGGLGLTAEAGRQADGPVSLDLALSLDALSPYGGLVGRPFAGSASLDATGTFQPDRGAFDITLDAETIDLRTGITEADRLLAGTGILSGRLRRDDDGTLRIEGLDLAYPNLAASADVTAGVDTGSARYSARLTDIGLFTNDVSGPATADGTARLGADGAWDVAADVAGPAGIGARVSGSVDGNILSLSLSGQAPLGLANRFIAPRRLQGNARFDLDVNGPASLSSVSGTVTTDGARLAVPLLEQAIEQMRARIDLRSGVAGLDIDGTIAGGGRIAIGGSVGLTGARAADLSIDFTDVVVQDPELYETIVDAGIRITGPITGGGLVSGRIDVGAVELRVPSSQISLLGNLPVVRHVRPDDGVRRTLGRAGLDLSGQRAARGNGGGGTTPLSLDIVVNAPAQVFLRGRGLDAELGGRIRIGGTTARPIPSGQLSLIRGRLDLLQQRFTLDEGSATLGGEFIPLLRLAATTEARDGTLVTIILEGPADSPEVTFRSVPDLPQDEVLARLIFGRNLSEITPLQAVQLASAAATLAGRGDGSLVGNFRDSLGLDDLDVTTGEDGGLAVQAGAYLGENIYTDVTVGADRTEIELNLDLTDDVSVTGGASSEGETSLGIFYQRDY